MFEKTIKDIVKISGKTLHKGNNSTILLKPLPPRSGIYFLADGVKIPLNYKYIIDTRMATTIGKNDIWIYTVEHLMSAIYGLNITNLAIEINSNEPPVLDGSSIEFLKAIEKVGIVNQDVKREKIIIKKEVVIKDDNKFVSLTPAENETDFFIDSTIDFDHKAIGIQQFSLFINSETYKKEIAPARTFGFLNEFEYLKSLDLALGADYSNVLVLGDDEVLNKDGLRFENEFVRHKILDVIGDLTFLGKQIVGNYKSFASSHTLNYQLIKKVLSDKENYEIRS